MIGHPALLMCLSSPVTISRAIQMIRETRVCQDIGQASSVRAAALLSKLLLFDLLQVNIRDVARSGNAKILNVMEREYRGAK